MSRHFSVLPVHRTIDRTLAFRTARVCTDNPGMFSGQMRTAGASEQKSGFRQKLAPMISTAYTRHEVQTRALPAPGAAYELHGLQAAGPKAPITDLSNPDCEVLGGGHRPNRGAKAFMGSSLPPRRNVCAGSGKCAVVRVALSYVAQGPKVCRLSAGGERIRTFGSATLAPPTARPWCDGAPDPARQLDRFAEAGKCSMTVRR
jgi:hypothetical protein